MVTGGWWLLVAGWRATTGWDSSSAGHCPQHTPARRL